MNHLFLLNDLGAVRITNLANTLRGPFTFFPAAVAAPAWSDQDCDAEPPDWIAGPPVGTVRCPSPLSLSCIQIADP
jgi:hypothetical protein